MAGIQLTPDDLKDVKPLAGGIQLSPEDLKDVRPEGADRPEWLTKKNPLTAAAQRPAHSLDSLSADIAKAKAALPSTGGIVSRGIEAGATGLGDVLDTATLGAYRGLRNAVGNRIAPEATAAAQQGENAVHGELQQNRVGQALQGTAAGLGYMTGAPEAIGESVAAGLGKAAERGPAMIRSLLASRPVAGGVAGAGTNAAITAAQDAAGGASLRDTLHDTANSALVGGAIGGTAGVVAAGANKVNQSRGAQARQFIEQNGQGATVGPLTPGKGGVFDRELAGLPANDKGIGAAAKIGAKNILAGVAEQHAIETSRPYRVMEAAIDNSPEAHQARDVAPVVAHMQDAVYDLKTASHVRSALKEQLDVLERYRDQTTGAIMVPERQLNGLRQNLMRSAKVGTTDAPSGDKAPLRAAAFLAKEMVDQGPYAPLNELYAEGMTKLKGTREQLGLKKKAPSDSKVDVNKLKLSLTRQGQNTATAGGDADIPGFKAANPALAPQADLPELQRAKADLSFHLIPQHGGLMPRMAGAALGPGAALTAAAVGHGPLGLAAAGGMMALQNASPIAGRVLYPITRLADTSTGGVLGKATNPLTRAASLKRLREEDQRRALSGGP